jgi:hypothetical protein
MVYFPEEVWIQIKEYADFGIKIKPVNTVSRDLYHYACKELRGRGRRHYANYTYQNYQIKPSLHLQHHVFRGIVFPESMLKYLRHIKAFTTYVSETDPKKLESDTIEYDHFRTYESQAFFRRRSVKFHERKELRVLYYELLFYHSYDGECRNWTIFDPFSFTN